MIALSLAKRFLSSLLGIILKHPWQCLCAVLLAYGAWQYLRAERWEDRAGIEAANHVATKANYRAAQESADQKAKSAKVAQEQLTSKLAKDADHANENAALWRDAARRYAAAGGMRDNPQATAGGSGSGTGLPETAATQSSDGPGAAAVVCVSGDDFDALSENTERMIRVHNWGTALIAGGVAVPVD